MKRFLGEGGRKKVYLARDAQLDRLVAVALIKTEGLDQAGLARVRREAQATGRLGDHPHIVTVHDIGEEGGRTYIVSQYMGGGDVEQLLSRTSGHRLPTEQAVRIADEVCQALVHAHQHGLIHRDLKSRNVWLTEDGVAKLGDFGLAVALDRSRLTSEGVMVGTVAYMPPEQAMGREPDARADLYSLGCLLYEMVTGRPPFIGDDTVSIISQHLNTPPVTPTWHNPDVPPALETLILQLLAKAPEDRPPSGAHVLERLRQIASTPADEASIQAAAAVPNPANGVARLTWVRFIARHHELTTLKSAVDGALGGHGSLLMIVGDLGIGKSRLAEEGGVYARLRGAQVLVGRCYESEAALPYMPFVEVLRQYVGMKPAEALGSELGEGGSDVVKLLPELREKLPDIPSPAYSEQDAERYRLFEGVSSFLLNAAQSNPIVIVLDDLQWADRASLLLLQHLARRLKRSRLLVVGTYRDSEIDSAHPLTELLTELRRERLYDRIWLRGLTEREVVALLEAAAQHEMDEAGVALARALHAETEGNPFFIEEIMRHLVETGRIYQRDGRWRSDANSIAELRIPEGVREMIDRRLSRLSPECKSTLAQASVLGREFDFYILGRMGSLDEDVLLQAVEESLEAHVITEVHGRVSPTYSFVHPLVHQTLYEEISLPRRQRLHLRAAGTIEAAHGHHLTPYASLLAMHYRRAGSAAREHSEKAIGYAIEAGGAAIAVFAYENAARHWEEALAFMDEYGAQPELQARLLERLGDLMYVARLDRHKGGQYLKRALELYEESGEGERMAQTYSRMGRDLSTFAHNMDIERALGHFKAAERILKDAPERPPLGYLYTGLAAADIYGVRTDEGVAVATKAMEIAERLGNETLLANAAALAGFHLCCQGKLTEGLDVLERAWERADRSDQIFICFIAAWLRGIAASTMGDPGDALRWYQQELAKPRLEQAPVLKALLSNHVGQAHALAGDLSAAKQLLEDVPITEIGGGAFLEPQVAFYSGEWNKAQQIWESGLPRQKRAGNRVDQVVALTWLGHLHRARNDGASAENSLQEACAIAVEGAHVFFELWTTTELGLVYADRGRIEDARSCLERCREIMGTGEDWRGRTSRVVLLDAVIAAAAGDPEAADKGFERALELFRRYRLPWDETDALLRWAKLLADGNDVRRALEKLDGALEIYQRCGAGAAWLEPILALKLELQGAPLISDGSSVDVVAWSAQLEQPDLSSHAAPDGTVTLLFSDIEGSTSITERLGDSAWLEVLKTHNAIIRRHIKAYGGFEVKAQGDGFMVAYSSARKALHCAAAIQRAFHRYSEEHLEAPIKVRIGIHTGEAIREAEDFFGRNVILAARIAGEAKGGEILVSSLLKELAESSAGMNFGEDRVVSLKGLSGEHRVYSVLWLDEDATSLEPAAVVRLPQERTGGSPP